MLFIHQKAIKTLYKIPTLFRVFGLPLAYSFKDFQRLLSMLQRLNILE
jgi:hypothetical protein